MLITARMIFCFLAWELGFPTLETGIFLGIQQAAVSNAARIGASLAIERGIVRGVPDQRWLRPLQANGCAGGGG